MLRRKGLPCLRLRSGGAGLGQCAALPRGVLKHLIGGGDIEGGGGEAPDFQQNTLFIISKGTIERLGGAGFSVQVGLRGVPRFHGLGVGLRKGGDLVCIRSAEALA